VVPEMWSAGVTGFCMHDRVELDPYPGVSRVTVCKKCREFDTQRCRHNTIDRCLDGAYRCQTCDQAFSVGPHPPKNPKETSDEPAR
jgi:hypothetical protein